MNMNYLDNQVPIKPQSSNQNQKPKKKPKSKAEKSVEDTVKEGFFKKTYEKAQSFVKKIRKKEVEKQPFHQAEIPIEGGTQLNDLPYEAVLHILHQLPSEPKQRAQALANFGMTSKEHQSLISDKSLLDVDDLKLDITKDKDEYQKLKKEFQFKKSALKFEYRHKLVKKMPKFVELALRFEKDSEFKDKFFHLVFNCLPGIVLTNNPHKDAYLKLATDLLENWGKDCKVTSDQIKDLKRVKHFKDSDKIDNFDKSISQIERILKKIKTLK